MEGGVDGGGRGVFINSPPSSLHHSPPYTQTHYLLVAQVPYPTLNVGSLVVRCGEGGRVRTEDEG